MRIGLVCNDTRGGVQSYVALALGLRAAGHDIRPIAPAGLASLFHKQGFPAAALTTNPQEAMRANGFAEMSALKRLQLMRKMMPELAAHAATEILAACASALSTMVRDTSMRSRGSRPWVAVAHQGWRGQRSEDLQSHSGKTMTRPRDMLFLRSGSDMATDCIENYQYVR